MGHQGTVLPGGVLKVPEIGKAKQLLVEKAHVVGALVQLGLQHLDTDVAADDHANKAWLCNPDDVWSVARQIIDPLGSEAVQQLGQPVGHGPWSLGQSGLEAVVSSPRRLLLLAHLFLIPPFWSAYLLGASRSLYRRNPKVNRTKGHCPKVQVEQCTAGRCARRGKRLYCERTARSQRRGAASTKTTWGTASLSRRAL